MLVMPRWHILWRRRVHDVHLLPRGHVLECRREIMLGFRVRGWQICSSGGYFIICRDVHLLRGGHVLECRCDILQQQQQQQQQQQHAHCWAVSRCVQHMCRGRREVYCVCTRRCFWSKFWRVLARLRRQRSVLAAFVIV